MKNLSKERTERRNKERKEGRVKNRRRQGCTNSPDNCDKRHSGVVT
jgi:hypothetical protein